MAAEKPPGGSGASGNERMGGGGGGGGGGEMEAGTGRGKRPAGDEVKALFFPLLAHRAEIILSAARAPWLHNVNFPF